MGGQGSGKGTQAALLRAAGDYNYIETGALFRALPADSEIGQMIARGELVPDEKLFDLVASKMNGDKDILFDGFPRTLAQAKWLVGFAKDATLKVFYFNIPKDVMLARIQKRLNEGAGRADDADTAAVQKRLDSFFEKTMPAIEFFKNEPQVQFFDIDAMPSPQEIFETVESKL